MPEWTSDIQTTVTTLLAICGAIAVLAKAVDVIKGWGKPHDDLKTRVAAHDKMLANDKQRLDDIESANRIMFTCLGAMLEHEITGNSVDKLKDARTALNKYLIER